MVVCLGAGARQPDSVGVAYIAATGLPLLMSSQRTVVVLGAIVVAYALYWEAFVSVWCFFRRGPPVLPSYAISSGRAGAVCGVRGPRPFGTIR
jgi:hypothetical protein